MSDASLALVRSQLVLSLTSYFLYERPNVDVSSHACDVTSATSTVAALARLCGLWDPPPSPSPMHACRCMRAVHQTLQLFQPSAVDCVLPQGTWFNECQRAMGSHSAPWLWCHRYSWCKAVSSVYEELRPYKDESEGEGTRYIPSHKCKVLVRILNRGSNVGWQVSRLCHQCKWRVWWTSQARHIRRNWSRGHSWAALATPLSEPAPCVSEVPTNAFDIVLADRARTPHMLARLPGFSRPHLLILAARTTSSLLAPSCQCTYVLPCSRYLVWAHPSRLQVLTITSDISWTSDPGLHLIETPSSHTIPAACTDPWVLHNNARQGRSLPCLSRTLAGTPHLTLPVHCPRLTALPVAIA